MGCINKNKITSEILNNKLRKSKLRRQNNVFVYMLKTCPFNILYPPPL